MKLTLTKSKLFSTAVLTMAGLLHTASAAQHNLIVDADVCSNGQGWSIPGTGHNCTTADCCNWYQTAHVHDVGTTTPGNKNKTLTYTYTPGYYNGCSTTLNISTSSDGSSFTSVDSFSVVSQRQGGGWKSFTKSTVVDDAFRYVKIEIPTCYNDYSKIDYILWQM